MPTAVSAANRQSPRVLLREPIEARFDDAHVLIVELGLGGAKIEHDQRMDIGRRGRLRCDELEVVTGQVCHSALLPAGNGVVYHTGLQFTTVSPALRQQLMTLLRAEADKQMKQWESNLMGGGSAWQPQWGRKSAVVHRFLCMKLTNAGWEKNATSDPNQPLDGVTIPGDTSEEELGILCQTYERADLETRELMRRMATVSILERMQ